MDNGLWTLCCGRRVQNYLMKVCLFISATRYVNHFELGKHAKSNSMLSQNCDETNLAHSLSSVMVSSELHGTEALLEQLSYGIQQTMQAI
ncbi:hypothetical protein ACJMK2_026222 [Sinanodonta woodiana]|uniref:Uncharacterized protein n=1 Tax=Sinanodonta woodiana TaxID=1069815 RepID=A0ABD3XIY5_SINWO